MPLLRHPERLAIVLAGAVLSAQAPAADAPRSAGDMTVEERQDLMSATNRYQRCVYDAAMSRVDAKSDVRVVADAAFDACEPEMSAMVAWFSEQGFDERFAEGYTRHMRDRAGRKLLPELMMRKSQR